MREGDIFALVYQFDKVREREKYLFFFKFFYVMSDYLEKINANNVYLVSTFSFWIKSDTADEIIKNMLNFSTDVSEELCRCNIYKDNFIKHEGTGTNVLNLNDKQVETFNNIIKKIKNKFDLFILSRPGA